MSFPSAILFHTGSGVLHEGRAEYLDLLLGNDVHRCTTVNLKREGFPVDQHLCLDGLLLLFVCHGEKLARFH